MLATRAPKDTRGSRSRAAKRAPNQARAYTPVIDSHTSVTPTGSHTKPRPEARAARRPARMAVPKRKTIPRIRSLAMETPKSFPQSRDRQIDPGRILSIKSR